MITVRQQRVQCNENCILILYFTEVTEKQNSKSQSGPRFAAAWHPVPVYDIIGRNNEQFELLWSVLDSINVHRCVIQFFSGSDKESARKDLPTLETSESFGLSRHIHMPS